MNVLKYNVESCYFIGDIHGEFDSLKSCIKRYELTNCVLFCCGDIGLGFEKPQHYKNIFPKINRLCKEKNVNIIFIRGNHDDPTYFNNKAINYSHIKAVSDYSVVQTFNINDEFQTVSIHSVLCVGGATSIDRTYRQRVMNNSITSYILHHPNSSVEEARNNIPKGYWKDEQPVFNESILEEIKESNIKIDIVCTHTCPSNCQPVTKYGIESWFIDDPQLKEDITRERAIIDQIRNKIITDNHPLRLWVYGHYHYRNNEVIDNVKYIMLDMIRMGNWDYYQLTY